MVFLGCFANFFSVIKSAFRKLSSVLCWSHRNTDVSLITFFFFSAEGNVAWRVAICNGMSFCYLFLNIHIDPVYWKERCLFWDSESWMSNLFLKRNWWSAADEALPLEGNISEVILMQTHWRPSCVCPSYPVHKTLLIFWHHYFTSSGICFLLCIHLCIFCIFFNVLKFSPLWDIRLLSVKMSWVIPAS